MTPTTLALARRVRALLEAPERWTQGAFARTRKGQPCESDDSDAVCWCIRGALTKSAGGRDSPARNDLLDVVERCVPCLSLAVWNDAKSTTHADVLALLDTVIAEGER